MRDYPSDLISFNKSVEKIIQTMVNIDDQNLRNRVLDNSNFRGTSTFFDLRNINLKDFIRLSILSWYLPKEVSIVLRMDLEEKIKFFSPEDRFLLKQFLYSKAEMLIFLQETNLWHSREFFGNILNKKHNLDKYFKLCPKSTRVKKLQRKRGYQDQGSRVPDHEWLPKSDYSLTDLMLEIETKRQTHLDTLSFVRGVLT